MGMFRKKTEATPMPEDVTLPYKLFNQLIITSNILALRIDGIERFMGLSEGDFDKVREYMEQEGITSIIEKEQVRH